MHLDSQNLLIAGNLYTLTNTYPIPPPSHLMTTINLLYFYEFFFFFTFQK